MINNNSLKQWLLASFCATLAACSSSTDKPEIPNLGPDALYEQAKESMQLGNFTRAAETLSTIDSRYPFGPLSHQVQLDLIYVYYKTAKTDQALATIDRFVRLNPNHADLDYALYMRGLTNLDAEKNLFQEMAGIDRSDRDPTKSREAFNDFRQLLEKFPESKYALDAQKRMKHIKNRLAKYELEIARYYMRRQAYVAASNRGRYVLEYYADSPYVQDALEIMVESYNQLGLEELKNNALKTLKLNFPDSDYLN